MQFLDGMYIDNPQGSARFRWIKAPTTEELTQLAHSIAHRVGRFLKRRAAMTWAQRLKRVFNIDIETCSECGGAMKVIACIEVPVVIRKILDHLKDKSEYQDAGRYQRHRPEQTLYLDMENPFVNHKDVAGDTRQGWRSADGSNGTDHKAEGQSIWPIRPLHPLRLTIPGHETAGLMPG